MTKAELLSRLEHLSDNTQVLVEVRCDECEERLVETLQNVDRIEDKLVILSS